MNFLLFDIMIIKPNQMTLMQLRTYIEYLKNNSMESKNYELALEQFDQLLKEKTNYISALMGKAKSYLQSGQYQEAYDTYLKVLAKDPSDHYSLKGIGNAALFLDQADIALSYYKRALVFKPSDAQLYEAIAVSQMCTNDYLNAAESAKMASLMYNKKGIEAPYSLILAYFSYAQINDKENMQQVLSYGKKFNFKQRWPTPVVQYIKDEINASELISLVQSEKEEIEASIISKRICFSFI